MRLTILAVGRLKAGPERTLYDRYAERIAAADPIRTSAASANGRRAIMRMRPGPLVAESEANREVGKDSVKSRITVGPEPTAASR